MVYEKSNLNVVSDFKIMELHKDEHSVDLIIKVEHRCINLDFDNAPKYINSRIQFPAVKSILIRFCIIEDNNLCTIHFLGDNGIHSTIANFEMNYSETYIEVKDREFSVDVKIGLKNANN